MLTPEEATLRGRIGAHRLHATHNPKETTAKARQAFLAKFEREVDPNGTLPEAERTRRAKSARKAYFAQLAYASAKARKENKKDRAVKPPLGVPEAGHHRAGNAARPSPVPHGAEKVHRQNQVRERRRLRHRWAVNGQWDQSGW